MPNLRIDEANEMSLNINTQDGYKAKEWNKSKDGKQMSRIYIDGPSGPLCFFDLSPGARTQGQFVASKDASIEFGTVNDSTKAKVTLTTPGGHTIHLGVTSRTDSTGRALTREEQITMGMCMNNAGRLLPHMHDLTGKSDADVATLMVDLAQALFDRYV